MSPGVRETRVRGQAGAQCKAEPQDAVGARHQCARVPVNACATHMRSRVCRCVCRPLPGEPGPPPGCREGCGDTVPSREGSRAPQDEASSGLGGSWHCMGGGPSGACLAVVPAFQLVCACILGAAQWPGPGGRGRREGWGGREVLAGVPPQLRVSLGAPGGGLEGRRELRARTTLMGSSGAGVPGSVACWGLGHRSPGRRPVCQGPEAELPASGNFSSFGAPSQVSPPLHLALPWARAVSPRTRAQPGGGGAPGPWPYTAHPCDP